MTREEKLGELLSLVRGMRESQRAFYRDRDRMQLLDAKERERMVDESVAWLDARDSDPSRCGDVFGRPGLFRHNFSRAPGAPAIGATEERMDPLTVWCECGTVEWRV